MVPATTRMSSKGQVVIPQEIRNRLGLSAGNRFVVVADRDVIILKSLAVPSRKDFDDLVSKARRQARKAGLTKADIKQAVADVRTTR